MNKGVKVKMKKARKIKRKYEITSIDKILIIKEKTEPKNITKRPAYPKIWKTDRILSTQQNISMQPQTI